LIAYVITKHAPRYLKSSRPLRVGACPEMTFPDRHFTSFHSGFCLSLLTKAGMERSAMTDTV
ncbi:MAG: hypothetical protein LBI05_03615, partial [Planctomycetaceae bacterium]|nr:hypothetical protein [Planctomycetaceae bacterium]